MHKGTRNGPHQCIMILSDQKNLMTSTELTTAIASGDFTVTRLPAASVKRSDLVFSRIGGARTRFYAATGSGRNGREMERRIANATKSL